MLTATPTTQISAAWFRGEITMEDAASQLAAVISPEQREVLTAIKDGRVTYTYNKTKLVVEGISKDDMLTMMAHTLVLGQGRPGAHTLATLTQLGEMVLAYSAE